MSNPTTAASEDLRRALAAEEGGRRWLRRFAIGGVIALVIAAGLVWRVKHRPLPPPKYLTATATIGDVVEKVQATGAVQPVLQINVGAQVNGRVTSVLVDFNSTVKKGQVLAEIDPSIYGTQVSAQQSNVASQRAGLLQARAQVETARATMETNRVNYDRVKRLAASNLASQSDLDGAKGQFDASKAQFDAMQAAVVAAQAQVGAQEAQLNQTTANLGYTKIYSPVDGTVVTRGIDPGATVVASFQAPVLFVIAQDLRRMRVLADIDEADVGKLKEKMDTDAVVDAFPGETFHGIVQQLRFSPNNNQGVVTYSAVVEVANPEEKLRPGMTATVTVKTRESHGVLRIPNAALRYKPSPPKGKDDKPIPQPPEPPLAKGTGRVFVVVNDKPGEEKAEPKIIHVGATDGIQTEVLDGTLAADTKVVTDEMDTDKKKGIF